MTDQKWRSKNGHAIASSETDKITNKNAENVSCENLTNAPDTQGALDALKVVSLSLRGIHPFNGFTCPDEIKTIRTALTRPSREVCPSCNRIGQPQCKTIGCED